MGKKPLPISQILDVNATLYSGDIILFSGQTHFSKLIRVVSDGRWSHCGMVFRDKDDNKIGAYIWDVSKKSFGGVVDLYDLQKRIADYDGAIAYRPLFQNGQQRGFGLAEREAFDSIYDDLSGQPYETSKLELVNAAIDIEIANYELTRNEPDLSSVFCAELLAETYQRLALLSRDKSANEYVPTDFGAAHLEMLEKGYYLGKEIPIKEVLDDA